MIDPTCAIVEEEVLSPGLDAPRPRATLRRPASGARPPCLLVLPGFKGFRHWGFFPHLGTALARAGFASLVVDFSHNGIGDTPGVFTELDRFAENSLGRECEDARAILAAVASRPDLDPSRLGILGHSRGGSLALLVGRELGARAVATWAAVAGWAERFSDDEWRIWDDRGWLEVTNARTGQVMRIGARLRDDLRSPDFDPVRAAAALPAPLLLVHGDADESVPVEHAARIRDARGPLPTETCIVGGGTHTFGAGHPFRDPTPQLDRAIAATVDFFTRRICIPTRSS